MNFMVFTCLSIVAAMMVIFIVMSFVAGESCILIKQYMTFLIVAFALVLLWIYNFEPTSITRWDLLEHYKELDAFRKYGWDYAWEYGLYKSLYISNLYFFLISRLPTNNLFPVIPLAIDFCVFLYILRDLISRKAVNKSVKFSNVAFITSVWICTFGFKLAVSGVRCVTAVAVFSLALYLECIHEKKKALAYVLYIIALFIHFFIIALIFIRVVSVIKRKLPIVIGAFTFAVYGDVIVRAIRSIVSNSYIQEALSIFLRDWGVFSIGNWISNQATLGGVTIYICFVLVVLYLGYISWCVKRDVSESGLDYYEKKVVDFAGIVFWIALASAFNYLMLERLMYFLAYILLMILPIYLKTNSRRPFVNVVVLFIMLYLFFMNDIYVFFVNFTGSFFLAQ